jgi:hypothetical protein
MNSKKKTYILAGIFIVLILVVILISDRGEKTTSGKNIEKQFFTVDSVTVDKVELEKAGKKTILVKAGFEWRLSEPVNYSVHPGFVQSLISDLKNYKLDQIVSSNAENKVFYGFNDTNTIKVTVYHNGVSAGSMLIGNSGRGPSQSFVKKEGANDDIYLADGLLLNNFNKTSNEWRTKSIISIPKNLVNSIEYISAKESFKVVRDSTRKYFIEKDSVNSFQFDGIQNLLNDFNTQTFLDSVLSDDLKPSNSVKIDWGKITEIKFYPADEKSDYFFIRVSDIKQIFKADKNFTANLIKTKQDLLKHN